MTCKEDEVIQRHWKLDFPIQTSNLLTCSQNLEFHLLVECNMRTTSLEYVFLKIFQCCMNNSVLKCKGFFIPHEISHLFQFLKHFKQKFGKCFRINETEWVVYCIVVVVDIVLHQPKLIQCFTFFSTSSHMY